MNSAPKLQPIQKNLFLVGMMGTGKSTIGKILAQRLSMKFIDSDSEIEKESGFSIPEIFSDQGESTFRNMERTFINQINQDQPAVIACGGGLCIPAGMMELLKSKGHVICLLANPTTLIGRTQKDSNRPLLQVAQPLQALEKLLQERDGRYREADTIIDTDELLPEQVVERIIEHTL